MIQLLADFDLHLTTAPMCAYGMVIRDSQGNPEGLAQIDDVEEPAEEHSEDREGGDDDAKRSGQRVHDAL